MNSMRRWLCFLTMALGVAFALPGMGDTPNKHFRLSFVLGTPNNTQADTSVMATILNDNPSGSSSQISSFTISVANVSGITIASAEPDPLFPGSTVTFSSTSLSVSNIPPLKPGQSYTVTMHVQGCGDGNTWSAVVWSGSNFSGAVYTDDSPAGTETTNISCGTIACGNALDGQAVVNILGGGSERGPYDQDGACANTVNYFVTDLLTTSGYLHVRWDAQPDAAFFYIADTVQGTNDPPPRFAWKTDLQNNPIFVAGQACFGGINARTPAPFGTVISDNGGKIIKVDTTTGVYPLPPVPFPIIIGPKAIEEYLTVTKVSQQTWTVTRGPSAHVHSAGAPVMSTPKVLLPSTPVCFDSAGNQLNSCPYVGRTPAQMCYVNPSPDASRTFIFDIGDGYVKGSF